MAKCIYLRVWIKLTLKFKTVFKVILKDTINQYFFIQDVSILYKSFYLKKKIESVSKQT